MIKYIIGYIDSYGKINHKVVLQGDPIDSHMMVWPGKVAAHGKFRWSPDKPEHLNLYNEPIDDEDEWKIWDLIDKYKK